MPFAAVGGMMVWSSCWAGLPLPRASDLPSVPTGWCFRSRNPGWAKCRGAPPAREAGAAGVSPGFWAGGAPAAAVGLSRRLRDAGFVVELPAVEMKFGKSLGLADRLKARHAVILGEDELAAGVGAVKRLADGPQQKLGGARFVFVFARGARFLVAQASACGN